VKQALLLLPLCFFGAALPVWLVETAPPLVRYTVVGVGYNVAQMVRRRPTPAVHRTCVFGVKIIL
jgi:hypothetical protein